MDIFGATHVGKVRKQNEDAFYISGTERPLYAIVADGMGGHNAGDVASSTSIEMFNSHMDHAGIETIDGKHLAEIIEQISRNIFDLTIDNKELDEMGTTFSVMILKEGMAYVGHVGDSRIYLYSKDRFEQITKDHSYVQMLVDNDSISPEQAKVHPYKNIITRAVGMKELEVDVFNVCYPKGCTFIACTDGLIQHVSDDEIKNILSTNGSASDKVRELIDMALRRGGRDNVSVIVAIDDGGIQ